MDRDLQANPVDDLVCGHCGHSMEVSGREAFSLVDCEKCGAKLTVPVMLGAFMLVERMGAGGMGAVYRGMDTALNRYVAIKVMKASLGEDAARVESFFREARAAAALNHPNIVQIYSCGQDNGQPYIVMELVTGGKMDQMFKRDEPMEETRLLRIAMNVAEGLKAANEAGLVHGDIKPENILIDKDGTAKIVDFGLAQFVNAQNERGEIWGTPYYISPERARGNKADHRSDIYSLGASMFHALTGKPPFDGKTPVDVVLARLKHPPPALKELRPDVQDKTITLIERMMATDPYLRYPNSASLKTDMSEALEAAKAVRKAATQKHHQRNTASWVIAAIALIATGAIGYLLMGRTTAPPETDPAAPARPAAPVATPETPDEIAISHSNVTGPDGITRRVMTVQFFSPDEQRRIEEAAALLQQGDTTGATRTLVNLRRQLPRTSARQMWIPLLEAIPLWAAGDSTRADASLRLVTGFILRHPEDHPARMPQVIAQAILGDMPDERVAALATQWPAWFDDLRHLMTGLRAATRMEFDQARASLETALSRQPDPSGPAWAYAFRPVGQFWRQAVIDITDARRRAGILMEADRPEAARREIAAWRATAPRAWIMALDKLNQQAEARAATLEAAALETNERARRIIIQADLDRVDQALAEQSALILRNRDYRRAALSISTLPSEMQTPEGRLAAVRTREAIEAIEDLKAFLSESIERIPFNRADGSDLGGDVVSATPRGGVRVTLDGRTTAPQAWDAIAPRSLVRMADFYVTHPRLSDREKSRGLIALSLFSLYNGAIEPARQYTVRAAALDRSAQSILNRLAPGLLVPGDPAPN